MEREFSAECMQILFEYKNTSNAGKVFNRRIRDRICNLAEGLADSSDAIDFKRKMTQFYKEFGVGKFGLHKAFRIDHPEGKTMSVEPITNIAHVHLDDLVGYEIAKKKLIDNTEAFVKGKKQITVSYSAMPEQEIYVDQSCFKSVLRSGASDDRSIQASVSRFNDVIAQIKIGIISLLYTWMIFHLKSLRLNTSI